MATTSKTLARTAAATSNTTLYTVPTTGTTTVVTDIVVTNTAGSAATVTLNLDTVAVISGATVSANSSAFFSLKQVLQANATPKTITGSASAVTVNFHISGVEIV